MESYLNRVLLITVLLFFFLVLILNSGCNETELKSVTLPELNQITVDGNIKEWDNDIFIHFENKLKIAAYKDDTFYYLSGEILDKTLGKAFALSGITFLINPGGDKKNNIEMNFKYPGRKQVDYEKGGFFRALLGDQKIKVLKNLEKINDAVSVFDTAELKSFAFTESEDADFQGKMKISDNKLLFEIKIPIKVNKYFEYYNSLNEESLFCLTPGNRPGQTFDFPMQMSNNPEEKKDNQKGRPRGFNRNETQSFQYWFSIKADSYE